MIKQKKYKMIQENDKEYIKEELLTLLEEVSKKKLKLQIEKSIENIYKLSNKSSLMNFQDELEEIKDELDDAYSRNLVENLIKDIETFLS